MSGTSRRRTSKLVENEQVKLSATYLNGVAVALLAAGVLAPVVGGLAAGNQVGQPQLVAVAASCILLSAVLHFVARRLLRGLVE